MLQSNMAGYTMFVRVVDEMMNVIDFVEIGRYQFENEFLTCYKYAITFASSAILQINTKFNQSGAQRGLRQPALCARLPAAHCAHGSAPTGAFLWVQCCMRVDLSPWVWRSALTGTQLNATRF